MSSKNTSSGSAIPGSTKGHTKPLTFCPFIVSWSGTTTIIRLRSAEVKMSPSEIICSELPASQCQAKTTGHRSVPAGS